MHSLLSLSIPIIFLVAAACMTFQWIAIKRENKWLRLQARYYWLLDAAIMELRDTWDHLPRFIPMKPEWAELATEIGRGLPRLLANTRRLEFDPMNYSQTSKDFADASCDFSLVNKLVEDINDPTLTDLWSKRRLKDLIEILRLALFKTWQPGFDLSPLYVEKPQ